MKRTLLRGVAVVVVAVLAAPLALAQATTAQAKAQAQSQALAALFAASEEASLQRNPLSGLGRGDLRYAARIGNIFSDAYFISERTAAETELAALARIDRGRLSPSEQISYDVFKWSRTLDLCGLQPDLLALTAVRPIDHFGGFHTGFAELSSGSGAAPFKTVVDYNNGLTRIDDFVTILDLSIVRMRQGMATNVMQPRLVMDNVVEQLNAMLAEGVDESSFLKPALNIPATIPAAEQARLKTAYRQSVETEIRPALTRLRDFIVNEYLPKARTEVGLGAMPGGDRLYAYLVEVSTTTNLTPDQIHRIGLSEVTRIQTEMEGVKKQVGFTGTLKEFFDHIRTDPKFKPASREALQQGYVAIGKRLEADVAEIVRDAAQIAARDSPGPGTDRKGRGARILQSRRARRIATRNILFQRL